MTIASGTPQYRIFLLIFTIFVVATAVVFNLIGFFVHIDKGQAMLFGLFVALCAIPIFAWAKQQA